MSVRAEIAQRRLIDGNRDVRWQAFDARVAATYRAIAAVREQEPGAHAGLRGSLIDLSAIAAALAEEVDVPDEPLAA